MDRNSMRVFVDTNVFLDYIQMRPIGVKEAKAIFKLSAENAIMLLISDLTIANIKYVTRKDIPSEIFYETISALRELFSVVPVGEVAVDKSLALKARDFEDALQYFSAEQALADCIVTRNPQDFHFESSVEIIEPKEFLNKYFPDE
ncbi:MAG: PIN domain-containing protein [Prevotella sp.]|nr:PIN domain-containing protein [Prevotella sp.]